jgi:hypothetical protein
VGLDAVESGVGEEAGMEAVGGLHLSASRISAP